MTHHPPDYNKIFIAVSLINLLAAVFIFVQENREPATLEELRDIVPRSATSADEIIASCEGLPANSTQSVRETTRVLIKLPKDIYPASNVEIKSAGGTATARLIPEEKPTEVLTANENCWADYYEFRGEGEVEMRVKSAVPGLPDYLIRFIVNSGF